MEDVCVHMYVHMYMSMYMCIREGQCCCMVPRLAIPCIYHIDIDTTPIYRERTKTHRESDSSSMSGLVIPYVHHTCRERTYIY